LRPRARIFALLLGAVLLLPAAVRAADPAPAVWATLELRGGRVLHHVKVIANEPDSLVVRADEGLIKVAKASLLPPAAGFYPLSAPPRSESTEMIMQPFDPNPASAVRSPLSIEKPAVDPLQPKLHNGCSIVSYQLKTFPGVLGCAEIALHNDTDAPADIAPGDFGCITADRKRYRGNVMLIEGVPLGKKHKDVVPPHGDVSEIVSFTNDAIEIVAVVWIR
jgi:hypothetical protein